MSTSTGTTNPDTDKPARTRGKPVDVAVKNVTSLSLDDLAQFCDSLKDKSAAVAEYIGARLSAKKGGA